MVRAKKTAHARPASAAQIENYVSRVEAREAIRVTMTHCADMLRPLAEKADVLFRNDQQTHALCRNLLAAIEKGVNTILSNITKPG